LELLERLAVVLLHNDLVGLRALCARRCSSARWGVVCELATIPETACAPGGEVAASSLGERNERLKLLNVFRVSGHWLQGYTAGVTRLRAENEIVYSTAIWLLAALARCTGRVFTPRALRWGPGPVHAIDVGFVLTVVDLRPDGGDGKVLPKLLLEGLCAHQECTILVGEKL
jgi:hypothetical protein